MRGAATGDERWECSNFSATRKLVTRDLQRSVYDNGIKRTTLTEFPDDLPVAYLCRRLQFPCNLGCSGLTLADGGSRSVLGVW